MPEGAGTSPSPFVEFGGKTWYCTGDLVKPQKDGTLVFAGRLQRFVKLGGEMVSLPAIEDVLVRHYSTPADDKPVLAVEATPAELNPELVLFTIRDLDREDVNNRIREAGGMTTLPEGDYSGASAYPAPTGLRTQAQGWPRRRPTLGEPGSQPSLPPRGWVRVPRLIARVGCSTGAIGMGHGIQSQA